MECLLLTEALLIVVGKDRIVKVMIRGKPSLRPEVIWVVEVVCIVVCRPLEDSDHGLRRHKVRSVLGIALLRCEEVHVRKSRKDSINAGLWHQMGR